MRRLKRACHRVPTDATRVSLHDGSRGVSQVKEVPSRLGVVCWVGPHVTSERAAPTLQAGCHRLRDGDLEESLIIQVDVGSDVTAAQVQSGGKPLGQWSRLSGPSSGREGDQGAVGPCGSR